MTCDFHGCRQPALFWIGDANGPGVRNPARVPNHACADHVEKLRQPSDIVLRLKDRVRVG